jgi:hypothetical protein
MRLDTLKYMLLNGNNGRILHVLKNVKVKANILAKLYYLLLINIFNY